MILTGLVRLGRDGSLRHMPDGTPVLNMALAYNWGQKDDAGKRQTQWVDAALWGKRAESLAPHLTKGTAIDVIVEDVRVETYTDSTGAGRAKLVGRMVSLEFAGRAADGAGRAQQPAAPAPAAPATQPDAGGFDQDDVPF